MFVLSRWMRASAVSLLAACLLMSAAGGPALGMEGERIGRDQQILRLQAALDQMGAQASADTWPLIAAGPALRMGIKDPRVPSLRRRLGVVGDGNEFDLAMHRAVRSFQLKNGLAADGVVGEQTRSALNIPLAARMSEVRANLARWREQADDPTGRYILVNIPFMELYAVNAGQVEIASRVIVGKRTSQTPLFETAVRGVVFSPFWNIPAKIAQAEILPRARRDSTYLARNQIDPVPDNPGQWRQRPGPGNALGLMRFDLPNRYNVYLHDTSEKSLFANPVRLFSHGCVRVQDPARLAAWLLGPAGNWNIDTVQAAMAEGVTRRVELSSPVPVRFVYFTVWVKSDGTVNFRPDFYSLNVPTEIKYSSNSTAGGCAAS